MKKTIAFLLAVVMLLSLAACGAKQPQGTKGQTDAIEKDDIPISDPSANVEIKTSPDKYTWYVKNYIGKNLASIGYTSIGGDRMDSYGNGYIQLILLTPNGEYIDIHNEDDLKNWRVIGQSPEANTEIKYTYQLDADGNEYGNLISHQNIEEIVLAVAPIGETVEVPNLTAINVSPDRYTGYIRDYVGRILAQCGYISMAGKLMDQYGCAYIHLAVYADDGSYVDISDSAALKNYVVVTQSITPNTELKMTYCVDSEGNEYDNLIDTQNIEEIELYVTLVNAYSEEAEETAPQKASATGPEEEAKLVDGLRPEFKEAMDAYEDFYGEYCDFMVKYKENPADLTLLAEYAQLLERVTEMDKAFNDWEDEDLNDAELKYYLEVNNRVMQMLVGVMG